MMRVLLVSVFALGALLPLGAGEQGREPPYSFDYAAGFFSGSVEEMAAQQRERVSLAEAAGREGNIDQARYHYGRTGQLFALTRIVNELTGPVDASKRGRLWALFSDMESLLERRLNWMARNVWAKMYDREYADFWVADAAYERLGVRLLRDLALADQSRVAERRAAVDEWFAAETKNGTLNLPHETERMKTFVRRANTDASNR